MAISPSVQQYQAQAQAQEATPTQQVFEKKFGEAAYSTFRAKYPTLLEFIVTFKTIDTDLDAGSGLGAFILAKGNDIAYVPVVLANGAVESCEMLYDKEDDSFMPLTEQTVKEVVNANQLTDYEVVKGRPYIQTTDDLFRRFVRPPVSSNPILGGPSPASSAIPHQVLAGTRDGVSLLPNEVKEKIANYFRENPAVLGKIAEFYPVEKLAEKLAAVSEQVDAPKDIPTVVSIDELTHKLAETLSKEQKEEILSDGYLILKQAEDGPEVVSTKHLARDLINSLGLTQISGGDRYGTRYVGDPVSDEPVGSTLYGTGYVFYLSGTDLVGEKCLVAGNKIFTKRGDYNIPSGGSLVIAGFAEGITEADLEEFGGKKPESITIPPRQKQTALCGCSGSRDSDETYLSIFYPMKNLRFRRYVPGFSVNLRKSEFEKQVIDGMIQLKPGYFGDSFSFVDSIDSGCLVMNQDEQYADNRSVVLPKSSFIVEAKADRTPYIASLSHLFKLLSATAPKLKLYNDGAGVAVKDTATQKTASFRSEADLAGYLVDTYAFSKEAVDRLIRDREVMVFTKQAFMAPSPVEQAAAEEQASAGMYSGGQEQLFPQAMPAYNDFDPEIIDSAAALEDPEVLDTGLLASVAGDESMKTLLVDMLPEFSTTVTKLGQAILMIVLNKDDLEDFYGREDYQGLLSNIRKVFKTLGIIVADLQQYINMH